MIEDDGWETMYQSPPKEPQEPRHKCGELGESYSHTRQTCLYYCSHCRMSFRWEPKP